MQKHKILYGILFLTLLNMLSGCAGKPGSQTEVLVPAEELQQITDICRGDGKFYAVAKDKILALNTEGDAGAALDKSIVADKNKVCGNSGNSGNRFFIPAAALYV